MRRNRVLQIADLGEFKKIPTVVTHAAEYMRTVIDGEIAPEDQ
jgi:hypothetical protein